MITPHHTLLGMVAWFEHITPGPSDGLTTNAKAIKRAFSFQLLKVHIEIRTAEHSHILTAIFFI